MIVTDQKISEMIPKTLSVRHRDRVRVARVEDRLDRVERTGADVAEDHAQGADDQRPPRGGALAVDLRVPYAPSPRSAVRRITVSTGPSASLPAPFTERARRPDASGPFREQPAGGGEPPGSAGAGETGGERDADAGARWECQDASTRIPAGSGARLRGVNGLVDLPARGALVGAAIGVVAAGLAAAPEPAQVVLGCAVLGAIVGCRRARRPIGVEPLVQLLLTLALARYAAQQLHGKPAPRRAGSGPRRAVARRARRVVARAPSPSAYRRGRLATSRGKSEWG